MMKKKSNRWSSTKALYLLPVAAIALAAFATPELTEKADTISESDLVTSLLPPLRGEDLVPLLGKGLGRGHPLSLIPFGC